MNTMTLIPSSKNQRNYAEEYRRRNELSRARGYRTYRQQRHRIETGQARAVAPKSVTDPVTLAYQQNYERAEAQKWSDNYGVNYMTKFKPEAIPAGVTETEYVRAYYDAFVAGNNIDVAHDLKYWLVDLNHFITILDVEDNE